MGGIEERRGKKGGGRMGERLSYDFGFPPLVDSHTGAAEGEREGICVC